MKCSSRGKNLSLKATFCVAIEIFM
jgi:hypothetical protein